MPNLCEAWAEVYKAKQFGPRQVARELAAVAGNIPASELTELHIQALTNRWKLQLSKYSRYAWTLYLRRLVRNIAAIGKRPDLLQAVPKAKKPGPRTVIAEPGEIEAMLRVAPPWLRVIILLASHAALRRGDCLRAAPIHYNAEARTLSLTQQKTGNPITVPVTETLAATLEGIPPGDPTTPFYEALRGRKLSKVGISRAWQTAKKRAKVNPALTLHDLRRTAAVSLYEVSKDLRVVEQMLGHASLSSTIVYLEHRDPTKLKPYLDSIYKPKTQVIQ